MSRRSAITSGLVACQFVLRPRSFADIHHNEAAASTAPAALNALEFVISMETGYFHSMNLAHPVIALSVQCTRLVFHDYPVYQSSSPGSTLHRVVGIVTYPNMRTSAQSISRHMDITPLLVAVPAAAAILAIRARHLRSLPPPRARRRCYCRPRKKGASRFPRQLSDLGVGSRRTMRKDWTWSRGGGGRN